MTYDSDFYESIRDGAKSSATVIAPLIHDAVEPATVIDVGCGEGWFGKAFQNLGCSVLGVEGEHAEPVIEWVARDLSRSIHMGQRYDLAVCLEVAEHLPSERAAGLVKELCDLAPVVLFSAAVPGQGGEGHQNEQWPEFWAEHFATNRFACSAAPRWDIWEDERVDSWYRQNLMLATKTPELFPRWFNTPLAEPYPVIHPAFFRGLMGFIHNMAEQGKIEWR